MGLFYIYGISRELREVPEPYVLNKLQLNS